MPIARADMTGKKNDYRCQRCGLVVTTVHKHDGVTPFSISCGECESPMFSSFYRSDQSKVATVEWYKPTPAELQTECDKIQKVYADRFPEPESMAALLEGVRQHVEQGGLLYRNIIPT